VSLIQGERSREEQLLASARSNALSAAAKVDELKHTLETSERAGLGVYKQLLRDYDSLSIQYHSVQHQRAELEHEVDMFHGFLGRYQSAKSATTAEQSYRLYSLPQQLADSGGSLQALTGLLNCTLDDLDAVFFKNILDGRHHEFDSSDRLLSVLQEVVATKKLQGQIRISQNDQTYLHSSPNSSLDSLWKSVPFRSLGADDGDTVRIRPAASGSTSSLPQWGEEVRCVLAQSQPLLISVPSSWYSLQKIEVSLQKTFCESKTDMSVSPDMARERCSTVARSILELVDTVFSSLCTAHLLPNGCRTLHRSAVDDLVRSFLKHEFSCRFVTTNVRHVHSTRLCKLWDEFVNCEGRKFRILAQFCLFVTLEFDWLFFRVPVDSSVVVFQLIWKVICDFIVSVDLARSADASDVLGYFLRCVSGEEGVAPLHIYHWTLDIWEPFAHRPLCWLSSIDALPLLELLYSDVLHVDKSLLETELFHMYEQRRTDGEERALLQEFLWTTVIQKSSELRTQLVLPCLRQLATSDSNGSSFSDRQMDTLCNSVHRVLTDKFSVDIPAKYLKLRLQELVSIYKEESYSERLLLKWASSCAEYMWSKKLDLLP
jgi:hypothetical protein